MDNLHFSNVNKGLGASIVCGCSGVLGVLQNEQHDTGEYFCGQVLCCARSVTRFVHRREESTKQSATPLEGVALWHKGDAVTCATARSEMPGVAQLQEVLARIGLFQAGVGTVLDAQLPFVLLLRTMQVAHGQV